MKNKKRNIDKKKIIRIIIVVTVVIIICLLAWFLYFYPHNVFKNNERLLSEAGARYYEINNTRLPKEEGRVISVTLNTLVKQDYLDGLYEAYGNKLCDLNKSNVKAVNKDGKYEYYTYLKCGSLESNVDHEGPVITLNGSNEVTISRGEEYKEPGIKKVVDNVDGKIDISKVTIDGNVNTSKVGTYDITYTVRDSLDNKTTITRKVVVEESFSNVVKAATSDTNGYYKGEADNNYVMFNNMVFRIVKINNNNTVTIASDEMLANVDYTNGGRFADSSLDSWLNDYFYNLLENKYKKLITPSSWCDDVLSTDDYTATECNRSSDKRNVGILSIQDYNNTLEDDVSFLDFSGITWYANLDENNNPWTIISILAPPLKTEPMNQEYLFNVRPAITLNKNTKVLAGDGSVDNPYILVENASGSRNTNINERQIGEYISYSGYIWRISGFDNDTTEIIMAGTVNSEGTEVNIGYTNKGNKVYNPNKEGNIGYKVINDMTRYVSTELFSKKKIEVPIYKNKVTYKGKNDTKTYNNIVTIPSVFDIFTAKGSASSSGGYWLIDSSLEDNVKTMMNPVGTINYTGVTDETTSGVKIKAYLKDNVYITDGNGSLNDPYTISN